MPHTPPNNIRIFIGDQLQVESERIVLLELVRALSRNNNWSFIFANLNARGRQIDFVVASEKTTLIIEAKHYPWPIHGSENGHWHMQRGKSELMRCRNAYRQALEAKNAFKDVLGDIFGNLHNYPNANIVVTPALAVGSQIPSDYKVSVKSLLNLTDIIEENSKLTFNYNDWLRVAGELSLQEVLSIEEATDETVALATQKVADYETAFQSTYETEVSHFQKDEYLHNGNKLTAKDVIDVISVNPDPLLIKGPSGCGKSLLGIYLALLSFSRGFIPIIIKAKYFDGKLFNSLNQEIGLLGQHSLSSLLSATKILSKQILLVIDGYNECSATERATLSRSLYAARKRHNVSCIISSQTDLEKIELLKPDLLRVFYPSKKLKLSIAKAELSDNQSTDYYEIIDAVMSGMEASIIGKIGSRLPKSVSSFTLFDTYVREIMNEEATESIALLSAIAGYLINRTSFSISIRQAERIINRENIRPEILVKLKQKKLFVFHEDRLSFCHELFFNTYAAEWTIRQSCGNTEALTASLSSPRLFASRDFIIGALDEELDLEKVSRNISDHDLLTDIDKGKCGKPAQKWLKDQYEPLVHKAIEELQQLDLSPISNEWEGILIEKPAFDVWSQQEKIKLRLAAQSEGLTIYLRKIFSAMSILDKIIELASEETEKQKSISRTQAYNIIFARCHVFNASQIALISLANDIATPVSFLERNTHSNSVTRELLEIWSTLNSPSQFYFLFKIALHRCTHDTAFIEPIIWLLRNAWTIAPYHLRLETLQLIQTMNATHHEKRNELISALEDLPKSSNIFLNSSVIDALNSLGALDEQKWLALEEIKQELNEILTQTSNPDAWGAAHGFFSAQLDHPYADAYWEAMEGLPKEDYSSFLAMACRGADNHSMSAGMILDRLGESEPNSFIIESVRKKLALPTVNSFMPQYAIDTFVAAHKTLAKLGGNLPDLDSYDLFNNATRTSLASCGQLIFHATRLEIEGESHRDEFEKACLQLRQLSPAQTLTTILLLTSSDMGDRKAKKNLLDLAPDTLLAIARDGLCDTRKPEFYFGDRDFSWGNTHRSIAIEIIKILGDKNDLPLLRSLVDDPIVGINAIKAVREIEAKRQN